MVDQRRENEVTIDRLLVDAAEPEQQDDEFLKAYL